MVAKKALLSLGATVIGILGLAHPSHAINFGMAVSDQEALTEGMIKMGGSPQSLFCSGILLTNDWVLTSNHCGFALTNPLSLTALLGNGITALNHEYYGSTGNFVVGHPTLDFALVHLAKPLIAPNKLPADYIRGIYTDDSASLNKKKLTIYGFGERENGASGELYKLDVKGTPTFDIFNFFVKYQGNQFSNSGDSGGPIITSSSAPNVVVGVNKNSSFARPENFGEWALSYLYNRPVELPKVWYTYNTPLCINNNYCTLWDTPLKDNFQNEWTFDPCPGGSYSWNASYDLEPNADFIFLTSNGLKTTLTGNNGTLGGSGKGPLTIGVKTNGSKRSEGMRKMTYTCSSPVLPSFLEKNFVSKLPKPYLPANYTAYENFYPCADTISGSTGFNVEVAYNFTGNDYGQISYFDDNADFVKTKVTGTGIFKDHVRILDIGFDSFTAPSSTSASSTNIGFVSSTAICDMKLLCHGPECFTVPEKLPNKLSSTGIFWDPCNGGKFTWQADFDFPYNHANLWVRKADKTGAQSVLAGNKTSKWIKAEGKLLLNVFTDGTTPGEGLRSIKAVCEAW